MPSKSYTKEDESVVRVKICGITKMSDALYAERAGADAIGMVVCSDSLRNITLGEAAEIIGALGPFTSTVCVTHTSSTDELESILALRPSAVQISHPFPLPEDGSVKVIRVVQPGDNLIRVVQPDGDRRADCDAVIVDGSRGTGRAFDPVFARTVVEQASVPVILAGGLSPANVRKAIALVRPYAVDVCSGVEASPGIKDGERVAAFIEASRRDAAYPEKIGHILKG
jgi:phosphoribosylanthranilate isomerase